MEWLGAVMLAAFTAALAGGAHCAAMCGGIVGVACGDSRAKSAERRWGAILAFNAGRVASYTIAGGIAGALGAAGLALRGTPLVHQVLLAAMGATLLVMGAYVAGYAPRVRAIEAAGAGLWRHVQPCASRLLPAETPAQAFALGALWGWLPCGMVYASLIVALTTGSAWQGMLVMLAFGLGTIPNLVALAAATGWIRRQARNRRMRLVAGVLIAAAGVVGLFLAAGHGAHAAAPVMPAACASLVMPPLSLAGDAAAFARW